MYWVSVCRGGGGGGGGEDGCKSFCAQFPLLYTRNRIRDRIKPDGNLNWKLSSWLFNEWFLSFIKNASKILPFNLCFGFLHTIFHVNTWPSVSNDNPAPQLRDIIKMRVIIYLPFVPKTRNLQNYFFPY